MAALWGEIRSMQTLKLLIRGAACLQLALVGVPAFAQELTVSGFGTLGYAVSNQPYRYQRYIDNGGSFERDSLLAVQIDASLTSRIGATLQFKLAPEVGDDTRWSPKLAWGFVSWRPNDDLLLRAGKLRIPLYLHAENMDVGASFDYARLPAEVYLMAPTSDFTGVSATKSWDVGAAGELSLDAYWGDARTKWRQHIRDEVPGFLRAGTYFDQVDITARGLALTYRDDGNVYRAGLLKSSVRRANGENWLDRPGLISDPLMPSVSYYWLLPGAGIPESRTIEMLIASVGLDAGIGRQFRVGAEYFIRRSGDVQRGLDGAGGYVSLRRQMGAWTPYVYYAQLKSESGGLDTYRTINGHTVPSFVPLSPVINASQRAVADALYVADQQSLAIGTSYALTPKARVKAEWLRTRVGVVSNLVDAPSGSDVRNQNIDVLSVSYSFIF